MEEGFRVGGMACAAALNSVPSAEKTLKLVSSPCREPELLHEPIHYTRIQGSILNTLSLNCLWTTGFVEKTVMWL